MRVGYQNSVFDVDPSLQLNIYAYMNSMRLSDQKREQRNLMERIQHNKDEPPRSYLIEEQWVKKWTDYINSNSKQSPGPIENKTLAETVLKKTK